jgi:hypothetical protein
MPKFDYSDDIILHFKDMKGINLNEDVQKFVKINIGDSEQNSKYSYNQINIFVKLFIAQYSKFEKKLNFINRGKNVIDKCIKKFAIFTKYFTNKGFTKLLPDKIKVNQKDDIINILSNVYESDIKSIKFIEPLIFTIKEKIL